MTLIDLEVLLEKLEWLEGDRPVFNDVMRSVDEVPTVDAIPVEWILDNERMPKKGAGRFAILDMIEDWRKYTNDH